MLVWVTQMNYMTKDLPKTLKCLLAKQFQLLEPLWWRELTNNKMKYNLFVLVDNLNIEFKFVCQMHSFVILTCFSHKYLSINYYLTITFFSLETMFLLLKFREKHVFVFDFWIPWIATNIQFLLKWNLIRDTQICLFLHYTC